MNDVYIEVHVPFGPNRGRHLPPMSWPKADDDIKCAYTKAIIKEIISIAPDLSGIHITGVHFCGNGPWTLAEGYLQEIVSALYNELGLLDDAEVLLDVLPGHITLAQIAGALDAGVNRMDIELASSNYNESRCLAVPYEFGDFQHTVWLLKQGGYKDCCATIPVGIPKQTKKTIINTILEAQAVGIVQVSLRPFLLFKDTAMANAYLTGERLNIPTPDERAALLSDACKILRRYKYKQIDNTTFAFDGHESRLTSISLTGCEKVGIGCGADSWYGGFAYRNTFDVARYIELSDDPSAICESVFEIDNKLSRRRRIACYFNHPEGVPEPLIDTVSQLANDLIELAESGLVERVEKNGVAFWRKTFLGIASPNEFCRFGLF